MYGAFSVIFRVWRRKIGRASYQRWLLTGWSTGLHVIKGIFNLLVELMLLLLLEDSQDKVMLVVDGQGAQQRRKFVIHCVLSFSCTAS
jgi:hypothetical protein